MCISVIWGWHPAFSYSLQSSPLPFVGNGGSYIVGIVHRGALWVQKFTFGGLESWLALTLFTDMAGDIPFHEKVVWVFGEVEGILLLVQVTREMVCKKEGISVSGLLWPGSSLAWKHKKAVKWLCLCVSNSKPGENQPLLWCQGSLETWNDTRWF